MQEIIKQTKRKTSQPKQKIDRKKKKTREVLRERRMKESEDSALFLLSHSSLQIFDLFCQVASPFSSSVSDVDVTLDDALLSLKEER